MMVKCRSQLPCAASTNCWQMRIKVLQIEWDGYTFIHIYTYISAYIHTNAKQQCNTISCLASQLSNYI